MVRFYSINMSIVAKKSRKAKWDPVRFAHNLPRTSMSCDCNPGGINPESIKTKYFQYVIEVPRYLLQILLIFLFVGLLFWLRKDRLDDGDWQFEGSF